MALVRFVLKNMHKRVSSANGISSYNCRLVGAASDPQLDRHGDTNWWSDDKIMMSSRKFSHSSEVQKSGGGSSSSSKEVTVNEGEKGGRKKSKLFPSNLFRRKGLWRNMSNRDVTPFDLHYIFPSGLGEALMQAAENFNKVFENLAPSRLIGRLKEEDKCYKLRYQVPGLSKEDVKVTVKDGFLMVRGEHNEHEDDGEGGASDEEHSWSWRGYYSNILLPDDAKVDEIKAEMDGILTIIIPRTETQKKDVREVKIE